MKFIKIKENILEQILAGNLDYVLIADDPDNLSIEDKLEFFNDANVTFGEASISKLTTMRFEELKNSSPELLSELEEAYDDISVFDETTIIKVTNFHFDKYDEPRSISEDKDLNIDDIKIFTDGGSRGNPGPSASGYVLMTMDNEVFKANGVYLGITTNNQAEYNALKFALEDAQKLGVKTAEVYMDSLLIVNQLNGVFKIKKQELIPIYMAIKELAKQFEEISFTHVPRELNKLADAEVNKCLDAYQG